ncbi:hypothetical protein R1sor_009396 [Riccia sorocarpa]|uniref:Uncharacterized protein n=1 Tax=Riccia sorocarpa TaxID=122646 RepID=A0ABD3HYH5_9MARC
MPLARSAWTRLEKSISREAIGERGDRQREVAVNRLLEEVRRKSLTRKSSLGASDGPIVRIGVEIHRASPPGAKLAARGSVGHEVARGSVGPRPARDSVGHGATVTVLAHEPSVTATFLLPSLQRIASTRLEDVTSVTEAGPDESISQRKVTLRRRSMAKKPA